MKLTIYTDEIKCTPENPRKSTPAYFSYTYTPEYGPPFLQAFSSSKNNKNDLTAGTLEDNLRLLSSSSSDKKEAEMMPKQSSSLDQKEAEMTKQLDEKEAVMMMIKQSSLLDSLKENTSPNSAQEKCFGILVQAYHQFVARRISPQKDSHKKTLTLMMTMMVIKNTKRPRSARYHL